MSLIIDQIRKSCNTIYSQLELIGIAKRQVEKFEGILNLYGVLDNIYRTKRCIQTESRYGSRLVPEKVFIVDNLDFNNDPNSTTGNLYITDKKGRLKNNLDELDTDLKISLKKSNNPNLKVIAFFGGSTIMGDGAQLPQFSIPSLVEQILTLEYGIECVCINYGMLAWTIQDSFNLLTAEALKEEIDTVVFYTGWNCIRDFTISEALKKANPFDGNFRIVDGSSNRQVGFNYYLFNRFNLAMNLKSILYSFVNLIGSYSRRWIPIQSLQKYLVRAIPKYFPVQEDLTNYIFESIQRSTVVELSTEAVKHYRHINHMAKVCSQKKSSHYLSYFQPLLYFGNKPLSAEEKLIFELFNHHSEYYHEFYAMIKNYFSEDEIVDLTGLFDRYTEQLYLDMGHLNKVGNFVIAEKIALDISRIYKP